MIITAVGVVILFVTLNLSVKVIRRCLFSVWEEVATFPDYLIMSLLSFRWATFPLFNIIHSSVWRAFNYAPCISSLILASTVSILLFGSRTCTTSTPCSWVHSVTSVVRLTESSSCRPLIIVWIIFVHGDILWCRLIINDSSSCWRRTASILRYMLMTTLLLRSHSLTLRIWRPTTAPSS